MTRVQTEKREGAGKGELDVEATLRDKRILVIGCTGFVGKVMLSMLLTKYPSVGKIFALVRPGAGARPEERFFGKIATSPAFEPVREIWGDGYESFMREKVVPVAGDIGRTLCNFTEEDFALFEQDGGIDAIVNSAGLVTFTPSLESAIRINTTGARHCVDIAKKLNASLVHVSTCFVAGRRDGKVWENESVIGYFPRKEELRDDDFDATAEIDDCKRLIEEIRARAKDRKHISEFRELAAKRLTDQRRDPDVDGTLRIGVARERKLWVHQELTRLGMERADHWGWTNTYTYTKSLGEQIVLGDPDVRATIVRPAVVESSLRFPFAGWNEGFNTTAPLVYLAYKGQRQITAARRPLDVIPVDMVAAGMIMATAAVMRDEHEPVYHLGSSDSNPVTSQRLVELSGLAIRKHFRDKAKSGERPLKNNILARLETMPVSKDKFERTSSPRLRKIAIGLSKQIDEKLPKWGAPRVTALAERAKEELSRVTEFTGRVQDLQELFFPFTHDNDITFQCDNIRDLFARLTPGDKMSLRWDPESINWRDWWINVHFVGLQKWVFPILDDEFGHKPKSVYTYKDLLELFDATTKLNRHRVAMRRLPSNSNDDTAVYTYGRVQTMALQVAGALQKQGVEPGARVLLMSENRPEWGISYFGILKVGATVVPVDSQLTWPEVKNVFSAASASLLLVSERVAERLVAESRADGSDADISTFRSVAVADGINVSTFDDVFEAGVSLDKPVVPPKRGDTVASLIYTSGTTGAPKGVMLSHKNFTAMAAKLSSLFQMYRHDVLLSVLPLHHTFEFSAGLLMPMVHGSQITYLDEVKPESVGDALASEPVTAMVGVPALWQLLHRKVLKRFADQGPVVERAFKGVVDLNRSLRDRAPYGVHAGKGLFYPIHRALGGRIRVMISGGSALSPDVMKSFRGLGFNLFEGYGMTEASPVISAQRPKEKSVPGSVGRALPGIDVKIFEPDDSGVGEIIARGPTVMAGYENNPEATAATLRDGWLHTGDLGRIDDKGHVFVVGRKKDMILGASGENVYPDELEEVYGKAREVKEVSIVGIGNADGHETVAALVVPDYAEFPEEARSLVDARVREHFQKVSTELPVYKRVRALHLTTEDLPRTATRKVKRPLVVKEIQSREKQNQTGSAPARRKETDGAWVIDLVARVAQKPAAQVSGDSALADFGFDSLMLTELTSAFESEGVFVQDAAEITALEKVSDLVTFAERRRRNTKAKTPEVVSKASDEISIPAPVARAGRSTLRFGQRMLYERGLQVKVTGKAYVPPFGGYIVVANHASHLDMGLVKHALGESGDSMVALAARDYFFEDPVRKAYFENFTNLVPMERHGSLRESLRTAGEVVRSGQILLIFPEGTRSMTGKMTDFKQSLGYLALTNQCGILPLFLSGTYKAMPRGAFLPKRRRVSAHIGPFQSYEKLRSDVEGLTRSEQYKRIASNTEKIVRSLCPSGDTWALGDAGRIPQLIWQAQQSNEGDDLL